MLDGVDIHGFFLTAVVLHVCLPITVKIGLAQPK
jgi:hypothetical protein